MNSATSDTPGRLSASLKGRSSPRVCICSSSSAKDYECLGCLDVGWRIFDARPEDDYLGEIRACECGSVPSDQEALIAAGLPAAVQQHPVALPSGRIAYLDLAYLDCRLDVEIDAIALVD